MRVPALRIAFKRWTLWQKVWRTLAAVVGVWFLCQVALGPLRCWWDWRVVCLKPITVPGIDVEGLFVIRQCRAGEPRYLLAKVSYNLRDSVRESSGDDGPTLEEWLVRAVSGPHEYVKLPALILLDCKDHTAVEVPWEEWARAEGPFGHVEDDEWFYMPPEWDTGTHNGMSYKGRLLPLLGDYFTGRYWRKGMKYVGIGSKNGPSNPLRGSWTMGGLPGPQDAWHIGDHFLEWRSLATGARVLPAYKLSGSGQWWPEGESGFTRTPDWAFLLSQNGKRLWIQPIPQADN